MSMKLVHGEPNGPSLSVLASLFECGLEATLEKIDLSAAERHTKGYAGSAESAMSVEGEGPVLLIEGETLADSVFIGRAFHEIAGGSSLLPDEAYARWEVLTWCRWVIERVAPAAAFLGTRAYLQGPLSALADTEFDGWMQAVRSDDLRERWHAVRAGDYPADKVADSETKIADAIKKTETQLEGREFLFGAFSLADIETYCWLSGMREVAPAAFTDRAGVSAWLARVEARPSVQKALAQASVDNPKTVWTPGPEINRWG